jgi:hypothetical protein
MAQLRLLTVLVATLLLTPAEHAAADTPLRAVDVTIKPGGLCDFLDVEVPCEGVGESLLRMHADKSTVVNIYTNKPAFTDRTVILPIVVSIFRSLRNADFEKVHLPEHEHPATDAPN